MPARPLVALLAKNARRPEAFFEAVYRDLLASNRHLLSADSRNGSMPHFSKQMTIYKPVFYPTQATLSMNNNTVFFLSRAANIQ